MGAEVTGYALEPPTRPSLFALCAVDSLDEVDPSPMSATAERCSGPGGCPARGGLPPGRTAARPGVVQGSRWSTYSTNVMGTVNLLEAVRAVPAAVRAVVNVTTDKCYENREWVWGYRENESLGGHDPYSSSKACSELVTAAYRRSFFTAKAGSHPADAASPRPGRAT